MASAARSRDEGRRGRGVGGVEAARRRRSSPRPRELAGVDRRRGAGRRARRSRVAGVTQRVDDRPADVARAAEQHDRLRLRRARCPSSVLRSSRRAAAAGGSGRSPTRRAGSTDVADRLPLGEARVPAADRVRRGVRVLGEVVAAAGVEHELVEPVRAARPGRRRRAGHVEGERPARRREAERRRVGGAEALEHGEEAGRARRRRGARPRCAAPPPAPNGTTNWYCTNPRRPYRRFHEPTASSGWKNAGIDTIWPTRRRGALRYHTSLNAAIVAWLSTPGGRARAAARRRRWRGS